MASLTPTDGASSSGLSPADYPAPWSSRPGSRSGSASEAGFRLDVRVDSLSAAYRRHGGRTTMALLHARGSRAGGAKRRVAAFGLGVSHAVKIAPDPQP